MALSNKDHNDEKGRNKEYMEGYLRRSVGTDKNLFLGKPSVEIFGKLQKEIREEGQVFK